MKGQTYDIDFETFLDEFPYVSGFDFSTQSIGLLTNRKKREWITKPVKYISKSKLKKHIQAEQTIALPKFKYSTYMIIDIDNRSQKEHIHANNVFNKVVKEFGFPFYHEISEYNQNIHMYYDLEEHLNKGGANAIIKAFKMKDCEIEILHGDKKLRLPFSYSYNYFTYDETDTLVHTWRDRLRIFRNHKKTSLPTWVQYLNHEGDPIRKQRHGIINNGFSKDRHYGCGTRNENQIKIAFDVRREGLDYNEFVNRCHYYNDGTSKDMKLPQHRVDKILENIWSWTQTKCTEPVRKTNYNKPEHYIDSVNFRFEGEEKEKIISVLKFYFHYYAYGKAGGKFEERFLDDALRMLEAVKSKEIYDKETGAAYSQEAFSKLSKTTLFPKELKLKIGKYIDIKNPQRVWRFLELIHAVRPVQLGKYSYSYKKLKFAKHYKIKSVNKLYGDYLQVKNKISRSYYSLDYIYSNNIYINISSNSLVYTSPSILNSRVYINYSKVLEREKKYLNYVLRKCEGNSHRNEMKEKIKVKPPPV